MIAFPKLGLKPYLRTLFSAPSWDSWKPAQWHIRQQPRPVLTGYTAGRMASWPRRATSREMAEALAFIAQMTGYRIEEPAA